MKKFVSILIVFLVLIVIVGGYVWRIRLQKEKLMCNEIPQTGPCKASISKYYFDNNTKECRSFIWGGCDGNVPFQTMNECSDSCL